MRQLAFLIGDAHKRPHADTPSTTTVDNNAIRTRRLPGPAELEPGGQGRRSSIGVPKSIPSPASVRTTPLMIPVVFSVPYTWAELMSTTPARHGESQRMTVDPVSLRPTAPCAAIGNDPPSVRATPQPRRLSP